MRVGAERSQEAVLAGPGDAGFCGCLWGWTMNAQGSGSAAGQPCAAWAVPKTSCAFQRVLHGLQLLSAWLWHPGCPSETCDRREDGVPACLPAWSSSSAPPRAQPCDARAPGQSCVPGSCPRREQSRWKVDALSPTGPRAGHSAHWDAAAVGLCPLR